MPNTENLSEDQVSGDVEATLSGGCRNLAALQTGNGQPFWCQVGPPLLFQSMLSL